MALKRGIFIVLFCLSSMVQAARYQAGDVILVSLPCYICSLIELEENSKFSHIGIINIENGQPVVYEARGSVKKTSMKSFLNLLKADRVIRIIRLPMVFNAKELRYYFEEFYEGLDYDRGFLWNNFDEHNNEKLYCSELVYKMLSHFWDFTLKPKKMHFDQHPDIWFKYFKGNVPAGKMGLAPEDLNKSSEFSLVGDYFKKDLLGNR